MYMYMYVEIGGYYCSGYHYYVAPLSMAALLYSIHGMTRCMGCNCVLCYHSFNDFPKHHMAPVQPAGFDGRYEEL